MSPTPPLEVDDVSRSFRLARTSLRGPPPRLHALRGVSLSLAEGERLGVVGESGSGKSTLARLLVALDHPQVGSVRYRGQEIAHAGERELRDFRRRVQIIFQDPTGSLDPRLRVRDLVTEPLRALGVEEDHEARLQELLDAVGLPAGSADRYPHEFSGGQRQRVAIARALAPRPEVLIADEPVSALDVSVRAQILNLLFDLGEAYDLSLVLISHDLSVVHHVCDRVAVMYLGAIVEIGPTSDLFARPQHPYTQSLLRAIPTLFGGLPEATPAPDAPVSSTDLPTGCAFANRCPLVHDLCLTEAPPLHTGEDGGGHGAACHLAFTPDVEEGQRA